MNPSENLESLFLFSSFKPHSRFLVACSGGPDSVALVRLLSDLSPTLSHTFIIGHVNHKLRGKSSDADEAFVRKLALELNLRCVVQTAAINKRSSGNLEEKARDERYRRLVKMATANKCQAIMTAHTMDDQVETIVMNVVRGAGLEGLGGMKALRTLPGSAVVLARPLLDVSKSDLATYLKEKRAAFRKDATNRDDRFFRNWLRHRVIPMLEKRAPGFKSRAARLGKIARDEQAFWTSYIDDIWARVIKKSERGTLLDFEGLLSYSPAVQRRFFRRLIGEDLMTFEAVEGLRQWMNGPATSGRIWQLRKGWVVERLSKSSGSPSTKHFLFRHSQPRIKN